jgi:hypothetical protein
LGAFFSEFGGGGGGVEIAGGAGSALELDDEDFEDF